jgi:hypothetical protein
MASSSHRSPKHNTPDGITAFEGSDAQHEADRIAREAARDGKPDPLDGLVARIRATAQTDLAFEPEVLHAALALKASSLAVFERFRRELRGAKVTLGRWDEALRLQAREFKRQCAVAARARSTSAHSTAECLDAPHSAPREEGHAQHDDRPGFAAHYATAVNNDQTYEMCPGAIWMRTLSRSGSETNIKVAAFSARIVQQVAEYDAPDGQPRCSLQIEAIVDNMLRQGIQISTRDFTSMSWVEGQLGPRATVLGGPSIRDHARIAISVLSAPETVERYRFTGWHERGGEWRYLHAAGAIAASGAIEGIRACPPSPGNRFALPPPPEGEALGRCARTVLDLVNLEPPTIFVPLLGLVFRAALGPSGCTVHVSGRPGTGKTLLASLMARFFGATMDPSGLPASWADGSSAKGLARTLTRVGDAIVVIDDLRLSGGPGDASMMSRVDEVVRAHFNRAAPHKLTREGGERHEEASRGSILSTGEVVPHGHSLRTRMIHLHIERRLEADLNALSAKASDGELAAFMAAFLRWLAPKVGALRPRLPELARAAAQRCGFEGEDRTRHLLGDLMLGIEYLADFLGAQGLLADEGLDALRTRARDALRALAKHQQQTAAEEDPARRFLQLVGEALRSGAAHVVCAENDPRMLPEPPQAWGYRCEGGNWRPQGRCVGYLSENHPQEVLLDPGPALEVAQEIARKASHPLPLERNTLARTLHHADLLHRTELDSTRRTHTVRLRVGGGLRLPLLAVHCNSLSFEPDDEAEPDDKAEPRGTETSAGGSGRVGVSDP